MQLKTVGESVNVLESINNVFSAVDTSDGKNKILILQELKKATASYSTEAIKMAIAETTLDKTQIKAILTKKGLKGEILETTSAELAEITATNTLAASEGAATASTLGLTNAFKGLWTVIKANPITSFLAVVGAILYGINRYDESLKQAVEDSRNLLDDSISNYNDADRELSKLTDTAKETRAKLAELEKSKGIENLVNDEEYQKLLKTNDELERNIQIQLSRRKIEAKDSWNNAKQYYKNSNTIKRFGFERDTSFNEDAIANNSTAAYTSPYMFSEKSIDDNKYNVNFLIGSYTGFENKLKDISSEIDALTIKQASADDVSAAAIQRQIDSLEKQSEYIESVQPKISDYLNDYYSGLEDIVNAYEYNVIAGNKMSEADTRLFNAAKNELSIIESQIYGVSDATNSVNESVGNAIKASEAFTKSEMISAINGLSEGFEELDKIYKSISDTDPFDFALLDDKNFKDTFSGLKEEYENFVETVSDSPNDIKKCQDAFNSLVTSWIQSTGILEKVDEGNAKLTESMLRNMGVANASEVVSQALEKQAASANVAALEQEYLSETGNSLMSSTWSVIEAFANEQNASELTKQALAQLKLAQLDITNNPIDASSSISQILTLAKAAKVGAKYIMLLSSMESLQSKVKSGTATQNDEYRLFRMSEYLNSDTSWIQGEDIEFKPLEYSGGNKSNKESSSKSKSEDYFDWIERKIEIVTKKIEDLNQKSEDIFGWRLKNQLQDTVYDQLTDKINILTQAHARYMEEANKVGLSDEYVKLVQSGDFDITSIKNNDTLKTQISNYQKWYEKAENVKQQLEEVKKSQLEIAQTKITNITEDYSELTDKLRDASESAIGWQKQNELQDRVIGTLREQLSALNAEYERNNQAMKDSALSDIYKRMLEAKTLDLSTIKDQGILQLVMDYSQLLKNAEACNEAIKDVNDSLEESEEIKLDNIINDYESIISLLEKYTDYQKSLLSLQEKQGTYYADQDDYQDLIYKQVEIYRELNDEYNKLNKALSDSGLKKGSEKWNEMNEQLIEIKGNMIDCAESVEDFKDQIFELRFADFNKLNTYLDAFNSELSDMISLLGTDNLTKDGMLTDRGLSIVGLYGQQYLTAKKQATEYSEALIVLEASLYNGDITQEEYNEKLYEYQSAQRQAAIASKQAMDAIIDLKEQAIDEEIDAMNKLIEAKKEALDAEEALYEYQKKISGYNQNIAALEKQIAMLALATDNASKAKRLQLEQDLADAKEELADYQRDYAIDKQKEALDKQAEDYETAKKQEIEELRTDLNKQQELINSYLGQVKDNYSAVYDILTEYSDAYNMEVTEDLLNPFSSASDAAMTFSNVFADMVSEINYNLQQIDWSVFENLDNVNELMNGINSIGSGTSSSSTGGSYTNVTSQGKWQNTNGRWWYGNSNEDYVSGGYYNITDKDGVTRTYGFDNEGYMITGWDDSQGEWSYFEPENGQMVKSTWRQTNGKWYYLKSNGEMARDVAIKAKDGDGYYVVDDDGICENPNSTIELDEVKRRGLAVAYRNGTKNAKRGLALFDEEGLGSEVIISKAGLWMQFQGGENVLNKGEVDNLRVIARNPSITKAAIENGIKNAPEVGSRNVEFNSNITIQGDASEKTVRMIESALNDFAKNKMTKIVDKSINYSLRR